MTETGLATGEVNVGSSPGAVGHAAGAAAAKVLREALSQRGSARVIFASAPSQDATVRALGAAEGIDWSRVQSLHLDEYRGIEPTHPAAFGQWLADRLPEQAHAGLDRISTTGVSADEIRRYEALLDAGPIDLVCLGIGVNGHVAFNEPGDTDFQATALLREIALAHASRKQQVDEGLFPSLDEVPTHALTMTVPAILRAATVVGTVLGSAKAGAVATALTGEITTEVPASALRTHPQVLMFLDEAAASQLPATVATRVIGQDH